MFIMNNLASWIFFILFYFMYIVDFLWIVFYEVGQHQHHFYKVDQYQHTEGSLGYSDWFLPFYFSKNETTLIVSDAKPIPTLLWFFVKAASTLHLYRPAWGFFQDSAEVVDWWALLPAVELLPLIFWALDQLVIKVIAHSRSAACVSTSLFQILLFHCLQMLHIITMNKAVYSLLRLCNTEKTSSTTDWVCDIFCWIRFQRPNLSQHCSLFWQRKKTCAVSSTLLSQRTQFWGQSTPLSESQTRVGKELRQMCLIKLLTFRLDPIFLQLADDSPQ